MNKFYLVKNEFNKNKSKNYYDFVEKNFLLTENIEECDYILVLGGDGSILNSIQSYKSYNKPFLGISTGTIGYYLHNLKSINELNQFVDAKLEIMKFPLLSFESKNDKSESISGNCFADVWIERNKPQCLKYNINIFHDKKQVYFNDQVIIGDGILFSTPIGTTGYSKNIDDHILPMDLNVFQVVPISSSVNKRHFKAFPLSLDNYHVEIDLLSSDFRESRLIFDGVESTISNPNHLKVYFENKYIELAFLSVNSFRSKGFSWIID